VPKLIAHIIEQEHWKRWRWIGFDFSAPSIETYISAHPPKGLGASVDVIKRVLTDYPKVLRMFEQAVEAEKISTLAVQDLANQQPADDVHLRQSGSRKEDMLRRLRDVAEAGDQRVATIYQRVLAGEISTQAGMIDAGFRQKRQPKRLTPFEHVMRMLPELTEQERKQLRRMLR
jgi:hypothetical protein